MLLTSELLPLLTHPNSKTRVVNVASSAGQTFKQAPMDLGKTLDDFNFEKIGKKYDSWNFYCFSKMYNTLFASSLSSFTNKKGLGEVKSVSLHPGVIFTQFGREMDPWKLRIIPLFMPFLWLGFKDVSHGASTSLHCCLCPWEELEDKAYYSDCAVKKKTAQSSNVESEVKLWNKSIDVIEKKINKKIQFERI